MLCPSARPDLCPAASTTRLCAFQARDKSASPSGYCLLHANASSCASCYSGSTSARPPGRRPPINNCNYACNNIDRVQQQQQKQPQQRQRRTLIAQAERKICTPIYIMRILFLLCSHLYPPSLSPLSSPLLLFFLVSFGVQQSKHFLALWLWLCLDPQLDQAETSANVVAAT